MSSSVESVKMLRAMRMQEWLIQKGADHWFGESSCMSGKVIDGEENNGRVSVGNVVSSANDLLLPKKDWIVLLRSFCT